MKGESKKSSVLDFFAVLFPLSAKKAGGNEFPGKELNSFQTKTLRLSFVCRYFAAQRADIALSRVHAFAERRDVGVRIGKLLKVHRVEFVLSGLDVPKYITSF